MHARAVELLLPYLLPMAEDDRSSEDAVKTVGVNGRPRRVLDIGSGSGFLVHVFAELVGDKSRVVGLDHLTELRNLGEANMRKFDEGVRFLESGRVQFHQGDGRDGWDAVDTMTGSDHGWDVIHVGAGAIRLHEELVRQLRCPGRLFIPLAEEERWSSVQYIWTVDKDENGCICKTKHSLAEFVWLMNAPTEPVVYSQEGDV
ncbi:protein-L-isoaspartate O-methyltransferase-domain-containing protein [Elsinoe ampelina]|uniref:protein-L-isoaspartate(D-aspartate) O-methyltransferase n=1 Tax=Elsinoe ampelina TaxID=302913 RepID=A0A6A6G6J6_9PEZI|nr:protein-L-isoaspartate O-methyltransferase-domain-containing protein [Elsinoe ampelina]